MLVYVYVVLVRFNVGEGSGKWMSRLVTLWTLRVSRWPSLDLGVRRLILILMCGGSIQGYLASLKALLYLYFSNPRTNHQAAFFFDLANS